MLPMLMKMGKSNFIEEANKALYAVSALIRSNLAGQELFSIEHGDFMLQVTCLRLFILMLLLLFSLLCFAFSLSIKFVIFCINVCLH